MVRRFFVRAWNMFCAVLVTIVFCVICLFLALCAGFRGFVRAFFDAISEGFTAFVDHFGLWGESVSQRCD